MTFSLHSTSTRSRISPSEDGACVTVTPTPVTCWTRDRRPASWPVSVSTIPAEFSVTSAARASSRRSGVRTRTLVHSSVNVRISCNSESENQPNLDVLFVYFQPVIVTAILVSASTRKKLTKNSFHWISTVTTRVAVFAKTARTIQKASTVTSARTRSIAPMESAGMRRMSVNVSQAIKS